MYKATVHQYVSLHCPVILKIIIYLFFFFAWSMSALTSCYSLFKFSRIHRKLLARLLDSGQMQHLFF